MSILFMAILFFIPTTVLAADYTITNVDIEAYLQENGDVIVEEHHTYEFKGEFRGIIRGLIPNKGSEIIELEAFEDHKPLQIESDKTEHRIHREGKDETITIDLVYRIKDGVAVYSDAAEFYWSFFDKGNEATYENLTVHVIPPEPTTALVAFGYDEAFKSESILEDGRIQFAMGEVRSGRNGDIRVAYSPELFSASTVTENKPMYDQIVAAEQELHEKAVAREERTEFLSSMGAILVPAFALLLLFVIAWAWLNARKNKAIIMRDLQQSETVPKETLSLPSTICLMNHQMLLPESVVAALLDLVRKGHVEKLDDKRFRLVHKHNLLQHEEKLVTLLFKEIGSDDEFNIDDFGSYLKKEQNQQTYQQLKSDWEKEVRAELKQADIYQNKVKYRVTLGFLSILLVPFIILFAVHHLIALTVMSLIICIGLFLFALCYNPKTMTGLKLTEEWRYFKQEFPNIVESKWQSLSEDDKMRAFIFGVGINEKKIIKKNESLVNAFKTNGHESSAVYSFDPTWLIIASAASANVRSAEESSSLNHSSGGYSGGGSGAGGGGGGSGAF